MEAAAPGKETPGAGRDGGTRVSRNHDPGSPAARGRVAKQVSTTEITEPTETSTAIRRIHPDPFAIYQIPSVFSPRRARGISNSSVLSVISVVQIPWPRPAGLPSIVMSLSGGPAADRRRRVAMARECPAGGLSPWRKPVEGRQAARRRLVLSVRGEIG